MPVSVTHSYVATGTNANNGEVAKDQWNAGHVVTGVRDQLTADRYYYVRTDGNDSNNGLANTSGGAFLTIQKALNVAFGELDISIYSVYILIADGTTYAGASVGAPQVGSGNIQLYGNDVTPANVRITGGITVSNGAKLYVSHMDIRSSGYQAVRSTTGAYVSLSNVRFGGTESAHILADLNGAVAFSSNYAISGSPAYFHFQATTGGTIECGGFTTTLVGTPAWGTAFASVEAGGIIRHFSGTFSGSATGKRYDATSNGVIYTYGAATTYFPGNVSGTTASGGQYA